MTTRARPRPLTEQEWQRQVTALAEVLGWQWMHLRPARTQQGWRTAVEGPGGRGFPDLVLWRERVIFVELKAKRGRVSRDQEQRHHELVQAGAEIHVWRPADFDEARDVLTRRAA